MLLRSRSSVAKNGEELPPAKKRKKTASQVLPPITISSLPDDLVLSCLARVSRVYYPTLSLVSKKFRSLIASLELYEVRSLLGLTESCLYVSLRFLEFGRDFGHQRWFTLCRSPDTKKKKTKKSNENLLVPIPFPHSTQALWSKVVAIGSSIYFIGGDINNSPCSNVSVLDCRSHAWHQAPNMQAVRKSRGANVIDGKIYVVGRPVNNNSCSWIEVFDPKTKTWSSLSSGLVKTDTWSSLSRSGLVIDGKICMYDGGQGVAYNPKDGTFEPMERDMCKAWVCCTEFHCVVKNVFFYYHRDCERGFKWFDTKSRLWKDLKSLEGMPKITRHASVRLGDYGGKIAFFWNKGSTSRGSKEKMIWCAVISLERRRNDEEIWGIVEWFDCVLKVPKSYSVAEVISATL